MSTHPEPCAVDVEAAGMIASFYFSSLTNQRSVSGIKNKKPACKISLTSRLYGCFDCAAAKRSRWENRGGLSVLLH
jgi:hypothetical protein